MTIAARPVRATSRNFFVCSSADVDRVLVGVVGPADGDDLRGSVSSDSGDAAETALALQVGELCLGEGSCSRGHQGTSVPVWS
jgi:hypothetical protein